MEDEKGEVRKDLEAQREQAKRITLLLENGSKNQSSDDYWRKALEALETRVDNQEKTAQEHKERENRVLRQNRSLKKALEEEKGRGFFNRLFR